VAKPKLYPLSKLLKNIKDRLQAIDDQFFAVGELLWVVRNRVTGKDFRKHLVKLGLNYRKAMYLIRIHEKVEELGLHPSECWEVGWTKMSIIEPYLTKENYKKLFKLAIRMTAENLKSQLIGGGQSNLISYVALLTKKEAAVIDKALTKVGLALSPRGHANQRQRGLALLKLISK